LFPAGPEGFGDPGERRLNPSHVGSKQKAVVGGPCGRQQKSRPGAVKH
jgi:hypothetical protein